MPPTITIVGLGPGSAELLTEQAIRTLRSGAPVYLRTGVHPSTEALETMGVRFETFDALYETHEHFESVYSAIVQALVAQLAVHPHLIYAVPGHPLVAEATVQALLARPREYDVKIVAGLSFLEAAYAALGLDPTNGLSILDAMRLPGALHPHQDLLITQVYSPFIASEVKLRLLEIYPQTHPVRLLRHLGSESAVIVELPLVELDRQSDIDHLCSLLVPALADLPPEDFATTRAVSELVEVIRRLRDPEGGCPWDLEQTPLSLCKYILEEAYETVDAIESGEVEAIEEELGDLLLQVVLQAQIFSESDDFGFAEVARGLTGKLIRRHPHVFGDVEVASADEVNRNWEAIKAREKQTTDPRLSTKLRALARQMPALQAAAEISRRVAKVGFEWPDAASVWAKLEEELQELREALAHESSQRQAEELGDVLFTLLNVARWQKLDTEAALRETNRRFLERFAIVEQLTERDLATYTAAELEAYWQQAKRLLS